MFGGNGFVGSRVVTNAIQAGYKVVVACRSGAPTPSHAAALKLDLHHPSLSFVVLDAASRSQVFEFLDDQRDASSLVSCIGTLTLDHGVARRINGDANVNIAAALVQPQHASKKMVFVSAEKMGFVSTRILKGYTYGKMKAEEAVLMPKADGTNNNVVLRPGLIYGARAVGGVQLPLGIVGYPLDLALSPITSLLYGSKQRPYTHLGLLVPPVHVDVVAQAAVYASMEPSVSGIYGVEGMRTLAEGLRH